MELVDGGKMAGSDLDMINMQIHMYRRLSEEPGHRVHDRGGRGRPVSETRVSIDGCILHTRRHTNQPACLSLVDSAHVYPEASLTEPHPPFSLQTPITY